MLETDYWVVIVGVPYVMWETAVSPSAPISVFPSVLYHFLLPNRICFPRRKISKKCFPITSISFQFKITLLFPPKYVILFYPDDVIIYIGVIYRLRGKHLRERPVHIFIMLEFKASYRSFICSNNNDIIVKYL